MGMWLSDFPGVVLPVSSDAGFFIKRREMIPIWVKLLVLGLICAALVAGCRARDASIYKDGVNAEVTRRAEADRKQEALDRVAVVAKETAFGASLAQIAEDRYKERKQYERDKNDLQRRLRDGTDQLRIATVRLSTGAQAGTSATTPGAGDQEGSVVMPEIAADILSIAGDSSQDVQDFNALNDAYFALERACK